MKIVIPGGSGQVGALLARAFTATGDEVVILTRQPEGRAAAKLLAAHTDQAEPHGTLSFARWDSKSLGAWMDEFENADAVINLAGRSVNCRYHEANRRAIMDSRIRSTRAVGQAIAQAARPPRVWLQASTATIYAHTFDKPNAEDGILGGAESGVPETWRFSIDVAKSWEAEALAARTPRTRLVLLRSAMTMSPDAGGVFDYLLWLVRLGLGGKHGDGRQYVSWIHEVDFISAVRRLIHDDALHGPVNLAAPHPLPNAEFMRELRHAWGARFGLPATRWMLEAGTFLLRSETELILKSRRVVPGKLLGAGFEFAFPTWERAAHDLCARWRAARRFNAKVPPRAAQTAQATPPTLHSARQQAASAN